MNVTLTMNKQNDVYIEPENDQPGVMINCRNYELAGVLTSIDVDTIEAKFHTMEQYIKQDIRTYTRRLQKNLSEYYHIGDFAPKVIDGYVQDMLLCCTLTRKSN